MVARCCLSVGMGGTSSLVIRCCLRFNYEIRPLFIGVGKL